MNNEISKKLKILFLTPRLPYPLIGGDRVKPYNLLSYLGKHHDVTLVSFYQGTKVPKNYISALEKLNIKVFPILLNPVKAGLRTLFMSSLAGFPLEIAYYTQPEFGFTVSKLLKREKFDIAFSFFMRTAEYLRTEKIKKVLIAEDCRVVYQKRSYEQSENFKQRFIRLWEYKKLLKYEPDISNFFDVTTLVTDTDINEMKKRNQSANFKLLTNGVDIAKFCPDESKKRCGLLFLGKLDIWANVLMLKKIGGELLPEIRKQIPDAILTIVGANPTKEVRKLQCDYIKLIPNVESSIPYLQQARVFLHPHHGGSGIQNKLLEAMACGCPVVTTPTGNQGIDASHNNEIMLGISDRELIDFTVMVLKDDDLMQKLSKNSRELIVRTHSWDLIFHQMNDIMKDLVIAKP